MDKCNEFVLVGFVLVGFVFAASSSASTGSAKAAGSSKKGSMAAASHGSVDAAAMLNAHNKWRAKTGLPNLGWSEELSAAAQQWASHLAATTCRLGHSGGPHGENLFMASPVKWSDGRTEQQSMSPEQVVDSWGSEVEDYDSASNACRNVCGNYTQMVWRQTVEVGCAMAVCGNKSQIWVCNYHPAGNVVGQKPY